jgi:hypothetical protein
MIASRQSLNVGVQYFPRYSDFAIGLSAHETEVDMTTTSTAPRTIARAIGNFLTALLH